MAEDELRVLVLARVTGVAFAENSEKTDFLALCLLRLLVLQPSSWSYMLNNGASRNDCLDFVLSELERLDPGRATSTIAINAAAMRLAVIANLFALPSGRAFVMDRPERMQRVLDSAMRDVNQKQQSEESPIKGVRQVASAVLHNIAINLSPPSSQIQMTLPDAPMQIMLGCMESLTSETDEIVLCRRASTFGHIIQLYGDSAKDLSNVLGLAQELATMVVAAFSGKAKCSVSPETKKVLRDINRLF